MINPLAFNLQAARETTNQSMVTYCAATGLRFTWLRHQMRFLASEVRSNVSSLRFVGSHPLSSPNPLRWGLTIAFLLVVSPRRGVYLYRLARSYAQLGFFRLSNWPRFTAAFAVGAMLGVWWWR